MENMDQNENLTPRQRERRAMAEARRKRERLQYILMGCALVALVILLIVGIVALVNGLREDPAAPESTPAVSQNETTKPTEKTPEPTDTQPEETTQPTEEPEPSEGTQPSEDTQPQEPEATEPETTLPAAQVTQTYFFPDSGSRYLSYEDYASLSDWELVLARNEIFARHGRRFTDPDIQAYFNSCDWYEGTVDPNSFDTSVLNTWELQNIRTLKAASDARG